MAKIYEEFMKKIEINRFLKGIIVHAKSTLGNCHDWLILVAYVSIDAYGQYKIGRHISYDIDGERFRFNEGRVMTWGSLDAYEFYEPSLEQKQIIIRFLKQRGYKFVPILNKLIKKQ